MDLKIPKSWGKYVPQRLDGYDVMQSMIWDTQTYTDNSTVALTYFQTALATNTTSARNAVFALKNSFRADAMGIYLKHRPALTDEGAAGAFASNLDDAVQLINKGVVNINVNSRIYPPFPLWKLPAAGGVQAVVSGAGGEATNQAVNYANVGVADVRNLFTLKYPILIPAQSDANVAINWDAAVDTTGNVDICFFFEGEEARAA